jgi:hypothetical protein
MLNLSMTQSRESLRTVPSKPRARKSADRCGGAALRF